MKRVGRDGKAEPGTYTLTAEEARRLRELVRWYRDLVRKPAALGQLLHQPLE